MASGHDFIIIGSGFGGAVTACRLAEAGYSILILERGREWTPETFPRTPTDPWIFDQTAPEKRNGWLNLRMLGKVTVAQGAGVGGGSLIYANISVEAEPQIFEKGWPKEITYGELKPYYQRVGKMLNVHELPDSQLTKRFELMREAANKLGFGERFRKVPLAVTFGKNFSYDGDDPFNESNSEPWVNDQGVAQGTCVHCGNCDIGCPVKAKNTLDLNYLAWARKHNAEIRPLHLVRYIKPRPEGYEVHFDRIENGQLFPGVELAKRVIIAAGSLGSTELLLRCRDEIKTLPNLSPRLGLNWSSNGDFLTPAYHSGRKVSPTHGPTITCAIDFLDGKVGGQQFFIEDGGLPPLISDFLQRKLTGGGVRNAKYRLLMKELAQFMRNEDPLEHIMPWFAQGIDAADGRLHLRRPWFAPWRNELSLEWNADHSAPTIDAIVEMHKNLSRATDGEPFVPPTWTVLKELITPHPLGGCNMGDNAVEGVVSHAGEVFGYPGMYVADGAIVPEAVGLNPSRTIAALAERIAALIIQENRIAAR